MITVIQRELHRTISDVLHVAGVTPHTAGLRDRREQKNWAGGCSFPWDHAQHRPHSCCHCCSTQVPLAGRILQLTSAPCSTQQRNRGTSIHPLLPSHTLPRSWSPFKADYPWPGWHPGPSQLLSSLQGCREAGDSGRAPINPDHHTESQELCSWHSLDPAALAKSLWSPWVLVTTWRGMWGNLASSRGQIKSFVTKLS